MRRTEKADVRDKCLSVLLLTPSLFFFFLLLSLLYFSSSFSFPHILSSFLSFLRRALVSPWQVGIEEQPR